MQPLPVTLPAIDLEGADRPETLGQILKLLTESDSALVNLDAQQLEQLGTMLADKVDAYKYVQEKIEAEVARLDARIKEFQQAKKSVTKAYERLKELLAFHMKSKGFPRLPGMDYVARLGSSKSVKMRRDDVSSLDVLNYTGFVRVKYEWDKTAIKAALENKDPKAAEIAEIVESPWVTFDVNKGDVNESGRKSRKASAGNRRIADSDGVDEKADSNGAAAAHDGGSHAKDCAD